MNERKKVFLREIGVVPRVGSRCFVKTLDHPSKRITNWPQGNGWVFTSNVISVEEEGFTTENTKYIKHPDLFRN